MLHMSLMPQIAIHVCMQIFCKSFSVCMQDTSWLDIYLSEIPHVIYQVDAANMTAGAQHATVSEKGREAMGYLQFIIDYYHRLPASMVFLHGYRCVRRANPFVCIIVTAASCMSASQQAFNFHSQTCMIIGGSGCLPLRTKVITCKSLS